jgi:hypothetical protein
VSAVALCCACSCPLLQAMRYPHPLAGRDHGTAPVVKLRRGHAGTGGCAVQSSSGVCCLPSSSSIAALSSMRTAQTLLLRNHHFQQWTREAEDHSDVIGIEACSCLVKSPVAVTPQCPHP